MTNRSVRPADTAAKRPAGTRREPPMPEQASTPRPPDRRQQRRWVPPVAGWLTLLLGLVYVLEGANPGLYERRLHRLAEIAPGTLTNISRTADVIIGLTLLLLSHALRRRKKRAWRATMVLLALSVVFHILGRYRHYGPVIVAAVLLIALLWFRREFYATGDPRTRWRALWALIGLAIADVAIGLCYIALARGLDGNFPVGQRVQSVICGLVGVGGPVRFVHDTHADRFGYLTGGLGLFTLVVTGYLFLRPAEPRDRHGARDTSGVRELLGRYGGRDSLGYFALRNDKSIIWSPTGKSCIGYRVVSGVMLASGDPIGDAEAWPGAIHAFLDEAARHAWVPAVIGCSEQGAEVWCREGELTALELGDEAVVDVTGFSLSGRSMRNVRQMVTRVGRQGYLAQVRRVRDIPQAEIRSLIRQADSWRGSPTERGFSMALGRVGGRGDGDCVVATATEDGVLRAILHFVPWGTDGLSLDLMRRDRAAQPGLNDFLIVESICHAADLGVKRISLNFAMFRAALERGEKIGAGPVLRAWRRVLVFMSRWFQIESLYKFNAKFCPVWVPRFLVYPGTRDMPRIGLATLEAEAFLVWPRVELHRLARRAGRRLGLATAARWARRTVHRSRPSG